ncbi:MAG TPA: phosphate signaling complex protein PhoU [Tepidisphaeraceae bacterium]|jgi:phosphate transport system protein|nr:phosphate signaling complex protein PhoU [Tepidisphaeraceae bacterium]
MRHFDEQLDELFKRIIMMGSITESMIQMAIRAYTDGNEALAGDVYEKEHQVNALQVEVDDTAVKLTTLQQPVASDARFLFMASRIGGELERIADQSINIVQNTHYVLEAATPLKPLVDLPIMGGLVQKMVRNSMAAMAGRDIQLAEDVLRQEDQVDAFRDQIFRILLTHMMADPRTIQQSLSLILMARNLERIGDHATNIAEEVIYWIQGRDIRHAKPSRHRGASDAAAIAAMGNGKGEEGSRQ